MALSLSCDISHGMGRAPAGGAGRRMTRAGARREKKCRYALQDAKLSAGSRQSRKSEADQSEGEVPAPSSTAMMRVSEPPLSAITKLPEPLSSSSIQT